MAEVPTPDGSGGFLVSPDVAKGLLAWLAEGAVLTWEVQIEWPPDPPEPDVIVGGTDHG